MGETVNMVIVYDNGKPYHVSGVLNWVVDENRNIQYHYYDEGGVHEYKSRHGDVSMVITKTQVSGNVTYARTNIHNYNHNNVFSQLMVGRVK